MANIILQASEKKSQSVYNNGDWDTKFDEPISIEQGDMVLIDKVFIDNTVANVDQMKIKDDLTLKIVSMIYTQDWLNDSGQTRFQITTDSTYPNGKPFILAEETTGPVDGVMLTNVKLEKRQGGRVSPPLRSVHPRQIAVRIILLPPIF